MSLNDLKTALLTLPVEVYRYRAESNAKVPFVVWSEDTPIELIGNNHHLENGFEGTIDFYTKIEDDPTVANITTLLDSLRIYWRYESIQFEEDTYIIHHVFVFRVY